MCTVGVVVCTVGVVVCTVSVSPAVEMCKYFIAKHPNFKVRTKQVEMWLSCHSHMHVLFSTLPLCDLHKAVHDRDCT